MYNTVYYFIILCMVKISTIIFLILRNSGSVGSVEQLIKLPSPYIKNFNHFPIRENLCSQNFWNLLIRENKCSRNPIFFCLAKITAREN